MDLSNNASTRWNHDLILRQFRRKVTGWQRGLGLLEHFPRTSAWMVGNTVEARRGQPARRRSSVTAIANVIGCIRSFMKAGVQPVVRYADDYPDPVWLTGGHRKMAERSHGVLEGDLKLTVTAARPLHTDREGIHFLGVVIHRGYTRIQNEEAEGLEAKAEVDDRRQSGQRIWAASSPRAQPVSCVASNPTSG